MAVKLNVYKKDGTTPVATGTDTDGAVITGIAAGTVVPTGDYESTHTDDAGVLTESNRVPVPGFTVNPAQEEAPTNVKSTPTNDGATVTAG
ncbi:hypothetical protein [Levilactobacillus spicheri]|uniref:Uncharacterized protein n=1 Tax=Levilactobacillus spicheri TaxID=216463 RepID=A0A0F3RXQ2_9LACO|nr:hypothetical protein [Levilactobacillus spicheri]KJW12862.1 hypothetical protein VC81_06335 [Levilactobacillus spicheri]KJW13592.1 hypothetical protein VC81_03780 [Levilactobacillus spicheri]